MDMNVKTNALFACDALSLLERLDSEVVTLVYLDPPWSTTSGLDFNIAKSRKLSKDKKYASYLSKVVQQVHRVLTCDGSLFVHWSAMSTLEDVRLVMNQSFGALPPKYEITWHRKSLANLTSKRLKVDNEFILVYSKANDPIRNPVGTTWGDDIPSIIPSHERTEYATQKPLALMERIVLLASNARDLILDPFCGSGTTLVAAQLKGRRWLGVDKSDEARQLTINRLNTACHLVSGKDYKVFNKNDVLKYQIIPAPPYKDVLISINQIPPLQKKVKTLTQSLLKFKKKLNLADNADDNSVENAIDEMELRISKSLAQQSVSNYIAVVCSWLTGWNRLEEATKIFLPQAELLFENITESKAEDYSPFISQYCRALENEIFLKLFSDYTNDIKKRQKDMRGFLLNDIKGKTTSKFAKLLLKEKPLYTLGDMSFILNLMKEGGDTLNGSVLLKDFRTFVIRYFGEHILEKTYLQQINDINEDFRKKAAHPNILDAEVAQRCSIAVQKCLNKWILNYRQGDNTGNSPIQ